MSGITEELVHILKTLDGVTGAMPPADAGKTREDHLQDAFRRAHQFLIDSGTPKLTRVALVNRSLEQAMDTLRRRPDQEAYWRRCKGLTTHPLVEDEAGAARSRERQQLSHEEDKLFRRDEEALDPYQALERLRRKLRSDDDLEAASLEALCLVLSEIRITDTGLLVGESEKHVNTAPPTQNEADQMDAVFDLFRPRLRGENAVRDWKIMCLSSGGKKARWIGRLLRVSRDRVKQVKWLQAMTIGDALCEHMPSAYWRPEAV